MTAIRFLCAAALVALSLASDVRGAASADAAQADGHASAAFASLQALEGVWALQAPATSTLRISYTPISRGSALVERFGAKGGPYTETIYHRDGDTLLATHYCAQGNQPRLRLLPSQDAKRLVFEFIDATNVVSASQSRLVRMQFDIIDADHLRKEEVYQADGVEQSTVLLLERVSVDAASAGIAGHGDK